MSETQEREGPVMMTAPTQPHSKTSPIVVIAALSVIVFSAVGVGVMTGIIPSSSSRSSEQQALQKTEPAKSEPVKSEAPPAPEKQAAPKAPVAAPVRKQRTEPRVASTEPPRVASTEPTRTVVTPVCSECGTVVAVDVVEQKGEGSGLGAVAGGVAGALLGNQVGRGSGRKIATVAGAAGGAYAGHQVEKHVKSTKRYDVVVRMDDGTNRTFSYDSEPAFRAGSKVRVADGTLVGN